MAKVRLGPFGGVLPSVDPRNLPPTAAQTAENLILRYGDFRPALGAGTLATTVAAGTKSVHRTPSGAELQSTNDADFVNGQINDPSVERVYLTGRSAYPEAWQSGTYRRLGVRTPTVAPAVVKTEVDEYSDIEQQNTVREVVQAIKDAVLANVTAVLLANGVPTDTSLDSEWYAHGDVSVTGSPTTAGGQIGYAIPLTSGAATNVEDQYLLNPLLHGAQVTIGGNPYWAVPAVWRPYGYDVDEAAIATAIKALTKPAPYSGQLVPDDIADQIAARIAKIADPAADPLAILISAVNVAQGDVLTANLRVLNDTARVYALTGLLQRLEAAVRAVDNYFLTWETQLSIILEDYRYLIPAAVTRVIDTRFYVYTYVTDWGEESVPSPVSAMVEADQNDTVAVTATAPGSGGGYGTITHWRLYRSSTTNTGAEFQFVAETAIGTLTYNDSKDQEELEEVIPTTILAEPRSDMIGLCGGSNGIMLGFVGNTICACEPFKPYAWPREYELSIKHDIVAIVFVGGQSWLVLTEGLPYVVSGADSASLSAVELNQPQACVSKRSAVSVGGAALYASPDGICMATTGGVEVLTVDAYSREDWQALTPATSLAAWSEGMYHLWVGGKLITFDLVSKTLTAVTQTAPTAAYVDLLLDTMYLVQAGTGNVYPAYRGSALTATFKSPKVEFDSYVSFGWLRATGSLSSGTYTVWADGSSVASGSLTPNVAQRLPAVRGREWELQVSSAGRIAYVEMVSTSEEFSR